MSTPAYTISDIVNNILVAIQDIIGEVANVLAANASNIATALVVGGFAYLLMRYGSRVFRGITGLFRGMF